MKNTKILLVALLAVILMIVFLFPKKQEFLSQVPSTSQTGLVLGSWTNAGLMPTGVLSHGIAKLLDGRVVVAGGRDDTQAKTRVTQIFNPVNNTWSSGARMKKARENHTLSLITVGQNQGKLFAIGGMVGTNNSTATNSTELYNPATNTWSSGPNMPSSRYGHEAVTLYDGRIAIIGGHEPLNGGGSGNTALIYNPMTNTFSSIAAPSITRNDFAAVLLDSSSSTGENILVSGGGVCGNPSVEIYNTLTNTWTAGPSLNINRSTHKMIRLDDGKVLIVGGLVCGNSEFVSQAEIYDPLANTISLAGSSQYGQRNPQLAKLLTGEVLSLGGTSTAPPSPYSGGGTNVAYEYDPSTGNWTTLAPTQHYYSYHRAVTLNDGRVLVTGGSAGQHNKSELFNP